MAPNVTLHFFAANDISGSVVYTVTDEDPVFRGLTLKLDRSGLGGGELLLSRAAGEDFAFPAETFVRILIASYSDTDYYPWGLFLNKRLATVIDKDEDGGEVYRFGGAGPKMYLDRGRLGIGGPLSGWNVDLTNGVWRWGNAATVGRILERIRAQDSNMDDPALGALTLNFDETDDSNGVAWTDTSLGAGDAPYTIPIGTSMLQSLYDFEDLIELSSWVDLGTVASPKYELNVIQGVGENVTGSSFGAGVCLLREGDNIANSGLTVEGHALRKASHVIVEGADGAWVVVERLSFTPGDYVKYTKTEFPRTSQTNLLTKSGLRWLQRQDLGEREYEIDILPGANDAAGAYFPAPDRVLWLNNLISLDTSAVGTTPTLLDIGPSTEQLVTGIELKLGEASDDSTDLKKARSWYVKVNLNRERAGTLQKTPDQRSASSGGGSCKCIKLCGEGIACEDLEAGDLTAGTLANGDAEDAGGGQFSGGAYQTAHKHAGSRSYGNTSGTTHTLVYTFDPDQVFLAGVRYVLDAWGKHTPANSLSHQVRFGVDGGDEEIGTLLQMETDTGADGQTWARNRVCWTPSADRTGVRYQWHENLDGSAAFVIDDLALYTAAADDSITGTSGQAARCDHVHRAHEILFNGVPVAMDATDLQTAWEEHLLGHGSGGGGGVAGSLPVGRVRRSTDWTTDTDNDAVVFDVEQIDTHGFWSAGNPTRLTIPPELDDTYVILSFGAIWASGSGYRECKVYRNGDDLDPVAVHQSAGSTVGNTGVHVHSAPIHVSAGDYFEAAALSDTSKTALAHPGINGDYSLVFSIIVLAGSGSGTSSGLHDEPMIGSDGTIMLDGQLNPMMHEVAW